MCNKIFDFWSAISFLDKLLIIVLCISILAKLFIEIVCWAICKKVNSDSTHKKPCVHLSVNKTHSCRLNNTKYFVDEKCNRKKCPNYRISNYTIEQIKNNYRTYFIIMTIGKFVAELSGIILVIRTLFISITNLK